MSSVESNIQRTEIGMQAAASNDRETVINVLEDDREGLSFSNKINWIQSQNQFSEHSISIIILFNLKELQAMLIVLN